MLGFAGICHPLWFPAWAKRVEVGWRLRVDAWGSGYATEAGGEALRVGFDHLGLEEIYAFVHPDNHRSAAVSERLGMTLEERVRHPDRPHDLDVYVARPESRLAGCRIQDAQLANAPKRASQKEPRAPERPNDSRAAGEGGPRVWLAR